MAKWTNDPDDYSDVRAAHCEINAREGRNVVREDYLVSCGYTVAAARERIAREAAGDWSYVPGDEGGRDPGTEASIATVEAAEAGTPLPPAPAARIDVDAYQRTGVHYEGGPGYEVDAGPTRFPGGR